MSYTVYCQRCDRPALQRKIENTRAAWLFGAATGRSGDEIRLCAGCVSTIDSLGQSIARAKKRSARQ